MRLSSILLESISALIAQICDRDGINKDQLLHDVKATDPTGRKYVPFILKLIKNNNIRLPEDTIRVNHALAEFDGVKARLPQSDINKYASINDLETAIESISGVVSKRQGGSDVKPETLPGVKVYTRNDRNGRILTTYMVTDHESLALMGEGTKWCTRWSYPNCMADSYINDYGVILMVFDGNKPILQYTPDFDQVLDENDEPPESYGDVVPPPLSGFQYADEATAPIALANYSKLIQRRWPEAEPIIVENPKAASIYATTVIRGRWPEAEATIQQGKLKDALNYAIYTGVRLPAIEPQFLKSIFPFAFRGMSRRRRGDESSAALSAAISAGGSRYNYEYIIAYTRSCIKGRWPEMESLLIIACELDVRKLYSKELNMPVSAAQDYIELAMNYAKTIIHGRWPEIEPYIIKSTSNMAYDYAKNVVQGPWPEGERTIYNLPDNAINYALNNNIKLPDQVETNVFNKIKRSPQYGELLKDYREMINNLDYYKNLRAQQLKYKV